MKVMSDKTVIPSFDVVYSRIRTDTMPAVVQADHDEQWLSRSTLMAVSTRGPKNRGCMPNEDSSDCWTMDYQTAWKEDIGPDQLPPIQKSYKNV